MINHPPQVSFASVRLYNSAGTRIHNYELINALSPWHFSETYANSLGQYNPILRLPSYDKDKLTLHHAARPR